MSKASLSDLMADAEKASDAYGTAVVEAAQARADYELRYYKALAGCPEKSAAARKEYAEREANDEHRLFLLAEAREKAARTHVSVLLGLLVAKQSLAKHERNLDGGDW